MTIRGTEGLTTAYLVSQYPALSHEFIAREVRALRARRLGVRTFSVQPTSASQLRTETDRNEWVNTTALLASTFDVLTAQARLLRRRPRAWARGLRTALGAGPRTPRGRLYQLFYFAEASLLAEHMREDGLRHVHVHFANNSADVARIATAMGTGSGDRPWSWSLAVHGPTEFADVVGHDLADKVRAASFVACISDYCRSQLMALVEPEHWPKLHLVRMSVDPQRYPDMVGQRAGRGAGPLRVLFVGRLVAEKGPHVLLEAVAALPAGTVEVRMVGDGPLRQHLRGSVRELGIGDRVTLTGPLGQDELPEQYAWADAFCLPSFSEGLPVVLMEAMSTGLPVVTTRIAGIPELVEDAVNGLLVSPGRADLVTRALETLAKDSALCLELGTAAVARVRAEFDPARNAAVLARLLMRDQEGDHASPPTPDGRDHPDVVTPPSSVDLSEADVTATR